jgi:hypothetical protein
VPVLNVNIVQPTRVHITDAAVNLTAAPSTQASPSIFNGLINGENGGRREQKVRNFLWIHVITVFHENISRFAAPFAMMLLSTQ